MRWSLQGPAKCMLGLLIYWIWTNVLHAAHWSCSVMGKCRVWVSTQRHTVQRGSVGSAGTRRQNETAKEEKEGSFWEKFVILLLLQITRNTHAKTHTDNSMYEGFICSSWMPRVTHTDVDSQAKTHLFHSVSHPRKHMYAAYWHTHTPLISDPLLEWLAHLKWDKEEEEVEEGNKSRFTRPVPAPVSNFNSPASVMLYSSDTHMRAHTHTHTHTHTHVYISKTCTQPSNRYLDTHKL